MVVQVTPITVGFMVDINLQMGLMVPNNHSYGSTLQQGAFPSGYDQQFAIENGHL